MSLSNDQREADQLLDTFTTHPGTTTSYGVGGGTTTLSSADAQAFLETINQRAEERGIRVKVWIEHDTAEPTVHVQHLTDEGLVTEP